MVKKFLNIHLTPVWNIPLGLQLLVNVIDYADNENLSEQKLKRRCVVLLLL